VTRVVVTAFGPDRPGIVAAVTGALVEHEANLADTAMTNLAGQFAMVLVVEVPEEERAEALEAALGERTAPLGLTVVVRPLPERDDAGTGLPADDRSSWAVSVYGADRPGIVHRVTALLAQHEANVVDLTTRTVGAPGAPAYVMLLEVTLPADRDAGPLASDLRRLSAELDVEIHLRPDDADVL
jgi:glycine cleavage system transcriptional repressor